MSLVEVQDLSRSFGSVQAVRSVSFQFDAGQIFGFIGPNGAGKSTTMRILASLDLPSSGDCRVGGFSTVDDADRVRRMVGYMPDQYGSYPNMSVLEYLDFFARAHGLSPDRRRQAVADVVDFCQLGGLRDKLMTTLSKGMRQRLCLGRCLIHDPPLLILDEPSAGLDPRARIEFRDLLRVLAGQGKAVFISSHILAELEELCDTVAIIEAGQLVAHGSVSQVKAEARAARQARAAADPDERHQLVLRLAGPHAELDRLLAEQPELSDVVVDGMQVQAGIVGDEAAQAALLRRLVQAGLPICAFGTRDQNLEDVFLHLTEGKVQ
mgnify:CR=1 FL=1